MITYRMSCNMFLEYLIIWTRIDPEHIAVLELWCGGTGLNTKTEYRKNAINYYMYSI